jgi:hypothetical protein
LDCLCERKTRIFLKILNIKLERLLNGYLDQDIEQEIYRDEKGKLLLSEEVARRRNDLSFTQTKYLARTFPKLDKSRTGIGQNRF